MNTIEATTILEPHFSAIESLARQHGAPISHIRPSGCLSAASRNNGATVAIIIFLTDSEWLWGSQHVNGSPEKRSALKTDVRKHLKNHGITAQVNVQRWY